MGLVGRTTLEFLVLSDSLRPVSVFARQVMEVADHEHFISSMLFEISFVLFTMSLVLIAISSVFFSIPSVVFASSSVAFATSPILPAMATLAFSESGWTTISAQSGKLDGWFAYLLCAPQSP